MISLLQKKGEQQHQIWYEDHDSLLDKYMYVRSMNLRGKKTKDFERMKLRKSM